MALKRTSGIPACAIVFGVCLDTHQMINTGIGIERHNLFRDVHKEMPYRTNESLLCQPFQSVQVCSSLASAL